MSAAAFKWAPQHSNAHRDIQIRAAASVRALQHADGRRGAHPHVAALVPLPSCSVQLRRTHDRLRVRRSPRSIHEHLEKLEEVYVVLDKLEDENLLWKVEPTAPATFAVGVGATVQGVSPTPNVANLTQSTQEVTALRAQVQELQQEVMILKGINEGLQGALMGAMAPK